MNCSNCRFRKCLGLGKKTKIYETFNMISNILNIFYILSKGMSKENSSYGRRNFVGINITKPTQIHSIANTADNESSSIKAKSTLIDSVIETKLKIQELINSFHYGTFNESQTGFKHFIRQFYEQILQQSINKEAIKQVNLDDKLLPAFVLFCVLFDIKISHMYSLVRLEMELKQMTLLLRSADCDYTNFSVYLKALLFIMIVNTLFQEDISWAHQRSLFLLIKKEIIATHINMEQKQLSDINVCELIMWSNQIKSILMHCSKLFFF